MNRGDARVTRGDARVTQDRGSASPDCTPLTCENVETGHRVTQVTQKRGSFLLPSPEEEGRGRGGKEPSRNCVTCVTASPSPSEWLLAEFDSTVNEGKNAPDPATLATLPEPDLTPTQWLLALLDLVGAEPVGSLVRQCPAHFDRTPSLSIKAGADGRVLVRCFGGCSTEKVLDVLGMSWRHLFAEPWLTPEQHLAIVRPRLTFPPVTMRSGSAGSRGLRLEAVHPYGTRWLLERWRHPVTRVKDMRWFTIHKRARLAGLRGTPVADLPLYREAEVLQAVGAGEPLVVCESESSVDALCSGGIYATTWAGGAACPNLARLAEKLINARVLLVPDNDPAGLECADRIRAALTGVAAQLRTVVGQPGRDARDLLRECGPSAFTFPDRETTVRIGQANERHEVTAR